MNKVAQKNEEEYFARQEFERKKKLKEQDHNWMLADERTRLKEQHFMRCPKCGMELIEIDYKDIKIDKCSECGGIYLDNGELEAILKMNSVFTKFLNIFNA